MINLNILAPASIKYFGDLHPFRKWERAFREQGIHITIYDSHTDKNLFNAEYLLMHQRYFDAGIFRGWETLSERGDEIRKFLTKAKREVKKLIWFDANDSTGTTHFPIISFVDVFVKKQILKDLDYYAGNESELKNTRIWTDPQAPNKKFSPCPPNQIHKIKLGWNIAYFDYRNFRLHHQLRKYLSYFISYNLFPIQYTPASTKRDFDLTFRGTINYNSPNAIADQRTKVLELFKTLPYKIATGGAVDRSKYLSELRASKITISPFGYGEVCFRDFEAFISGSLLLKPSMEHLQTFPNLFVADETYVSVNWNLDNLEEKLDDLLSNYNRYQEIAANGQDHYRKHIDNSEIFISHIKSLLGD